MPSVPRVARRALPLLAWTALLLAPGISQAQDPGTNIVGGTSAEPGEYPWQVAVLTRSGGPNTFGVICGGTLISQFEVVTAAHCTTGNKHDVYRVRVGSQLRSGGTEISVSTHEEHPQFNATTLQNDAAVLHLAASGTAGGGQVLQLIGQEGSADDALWAPGDSLAISGWGSTFSGGGSVEQLREARVPRVADSTCGQSDYYGGEFFAGTMVCAGPDEGGVDTCQGDSGGPLAAPTQTPPPSGETEPSQWRLAGITSWGFGCAQPKKPGVYTRVAAPGIRNWILGTIAPPPAQFALTVTVDGTGDGTVTSNPVGINCPGDCSNNYVDSTDVTLTAADGAGSTFAGWGGACSASGTSPQCTVDMTAARSVTATFNTAPPSNQTLTVSLPGSGEGTVTSPGGINCPSDCSQSYPNGTDVTLTATAMGGSTFAGWGGACSASGTSPECTVDMTVARSVTATFNPPPTHALTVSVGGTGGGTVTSSPTGVNCPGDCSQGYSDGTSVTLTAHPAGGSAFAGWGGACSASGTSSQCTVAMTQARTVTSNFNATFSPPPSIHALTVATSGDGAGTVTSDPGGIDCGSSCSQTYANGTSVTLTASPATGSTFAGWSGACAGTATQCTVAMTQARDLTATFTNTSTQPPVDSTRTVAEIASEGLRMNRRGFVRIRIDCDVGRDRSMPGRGSPAAAPAGREGDSGPGANDRPGGIRVRSRGAGKGQGSPQAARPPSWFAKGAGCASGSWSSCTTPRETHARCGRDSR